jgi:hypothetical protein
LCYFSTELLLELLWKLPLLWDPPDLGESIEAHGALGVLGWFLSAFAKSLIEFVANILLLALGFSFLSIGALALLKIHGLGIRDPVPSLNLFWELAFFAYGIWWMQTHERLVEIKRRIKD